MDLMQNMQTRLVQIMFLSLMGKKSKATNRLAGGLGLFGKVPTNQMKDIIKYM